MFDNILGNEKVKTCLIDDLRQGKLSHAYIFSGISGVGKTTMAIEFASEILNNHNLNACPDFKLIQLEDGKKDISVEQIRKELIDKVYIAPASCDKKVYIIKDAEKLNKYSANALLKTLEEPPEHVLIILVTDDINKIIPTILSRVKNIEFIGIDNEKMSMYLKEKYGCINSKVVDYSCGSLGQAIKVMELDKKEELRLKVNKILYNIINKDELEILKDISNLDFQDKEIVEYLEYKLYENKLYKELECFANLKISLINMSNQDIIKTEFVLKII